MSKPECSLLPLNSEVESGVHNQPLPWRPESRQDRRMGAFWKPIRIGSIYLASLFVGIAIVAPAGEFVIVYLHKHHFYDDPDHTVAAMLGVLYAVAASFWFHWIGGATVGFAAGAWLDSVFGRPDRAARKKRDPEARPSPTAPAAPGPPMLDQADYQRLDSAKSFELDETCFLWVGEKPPYFDSRPMTAEARAIRAMLSKALLDGQLVAEPPFDRETDEPKATTRIKRSILLKYVKNIGESPPFLFPEKRETVSEEPPQAVEPKTVHGYYDSDFSKMGGFFGRIIMTAEDGKRAELPTKIIYDREANAKFVSVFVSMFDVWALNGLPEHFLMSVEIIESGVGSMSILNPSDFDYAHSADAVFSGRVYIYHESPLSHAQIAALESRFKSNSVVSPVFRGHTYQRLENARA